MKRFLAMLLSVVLVLGLAACGKEPEPQPQPEPAPVTETDIQPILAEIYCMPLEYGRLYLQGRDELSYPTLTVDQNCMSYAHRGNEVVAAFIDGTIQRFDLKTGKSEILAETDCDYVFRMQYYCDDGFVFIDSSMEGADIYRWRGGKIKQLMEKSPTVYDLFVSDGALVYNQYNYNTNQNELVAMNISVGTERWRVVPDCDSFYIAYQQDDTVYVNCGNTKLCRVEMTDGSLIPVETPFDLSRYEILYMGEAGYLLNDWGSLSGEPGVYLANNDGVKPLDYIPVDDGYCFANVLDRVGDKVLIRSFQSREASVFPDEEYGAYYSNYFYHVIDMTTGECEVMFVPRSENTRLFEHGDFPILDSSTARKPVTKSIYSLFCLEAGIPGNAPVCNTTHGAWIALADRMTDIALLAAPTEEEQAYLKEQGTEVEMKLYGGDGLVFIGNKACGVENLTLDDVRNIYRGKIKNWSQLGGVDAPIHVLYRDDQSGSQRLFEKMVWGDKKIPNFEKLGFERLDEMNTIVNACLYDPYTIGYSIMTYLNDVYGEEDLLAFTLEGVAAKPENVASGDYSLGTKGYVVIRADEAKNSPARRLYDWFGSPICDEILRSNGVTPLHE